jgi:UDPglucose 6-dehydrogenase
MSKNIAIIGSGYVGLTVGVCFSELGNKVICVDNDAEKIRKLKRYEVPIYEPGLEALLKRNAKENKLEFVSDIEYATKNSSIIFICVGTPPKENGEPDLSAIEKVAESIAKASNSYKIIVEKSTAPVNTALWLNDVMRKYIKTDFDIAVNPEFLGEGSAIRDFMNPDRIIIGTDSKKAYAELTELYKPLNAPILQTDINSAELIKHSSNAMLALRISTINLIAKLCEKTNADIGIVSKGVGLDKRIGTEFLNAGIGYGGFCLPKDLDAFIHIMEYNNIDAGLFKKAQEINYSMREHFINKIINRFSRMGGLEGKFIGVLGLAFKPNTDDVRFAPSIDIIKSLKLEKARIKAYDPEAINNSKRILDLDYCNNAYEAARSVDALLILTEWQEFKDVDLTRIKGLMKKPLIFDGRNLYNKERMKNLGFEYYCIGR